MQFSVIVTCYNYADYVCEAVDSALAQTVPPHEIIVVNDGSTDDSQARLDSRYLENPHIRIIRQANRGQLAAFTAGCREASGDVICFLDADDLWKQNYLQALQLAYDAPSRPDAVFSNLVRFGKNDGMWHTWVEDMDIGQTVLPSWFLHRNPGAPTSSISMKRTSTQAIQNIPEAFFPEWRVRADDCLTLSASIFGARTRVLSYPYIQYRVHSENNWAQRNRDYAEQARHAFRFASLATYFGSRAGLSPQHLHYAFLEFKTRSHPRFDELLQYLWLQWQSPRPWTQKLRPMAALIKHFMGSRSIT